MLRDKYLYRDAIRESLEPDTSLVVRTSSDAGSLYTPFKSGADNSNVGGLMIQGYGKFRGLTTTDAMIRIAAVGGPVGKNGTSLTDIPSIPTLARVMRKDYGIKNYGNGTCSLLCDPSNTKRTFNVHFQCIQEQIEYSNAYGMSSDIGLSLSNGERSGLGGFYENVVDTGTLGNGSTITIERQTLGAPFPWTSTDIGLTISGGTIGDTVLSCNMDLEDTYNNDVVIINDKPYTILYYDNSDSGTNYQMAITPPLRETLSSGTYSCEILDDTAGYVVTTVANGVTKTYYKTSLGARIVTLFGVRHVLEHGGLDASDTIVSASAIQMDLDRYTHLSDCIPAIEETVTLSFGIDRSVPMFRVYTEVCGGDGEASQVANVFPVDSELDAYTDIFTGGYAVSVKLVNGTKPFKIGDGFIVSCLQATYQYSLDGGVNYYVTQYPIYDSVDGSNHAILSLSDGISLKITTMAYKEPFTAGDTYNTQASYMYSYANLANPSRFLKWRTMRSSNGQCIVIDAGIGETFSADMLCILDSNLTLNAATVSVFGLSGTKVEKLYGQATGVSEGATTTAISTGKSMTANELAGGTFCVSTGNAKGYSYTIASNTSGGVITVNGLLSTLGMLTGDYYVISPPTTFATYNTSKTVDSVDNFYIDMETTRAYRGWVIFFSDATNVDGYIQMSLCRLGKSYSPTNIEGDTEPHLITPETIDILEKVHMSSTGVDIRYPAGVKQVTLPIRFEFIDTNTTYTYDKMLDMYNYVNNLYRRVPVIFFPEYDDDHETVKYTFLYGWFEGGASFEKTNTYGNIEIVFKSIEKN